MTTGAGISPERHCWWRRIAAPAALLLLMAGSSPSLAQMGEDAPEPATAPALALEPLDIPSDAWADSSADPVDAPAADDADSDADADSADDSGEHLGTGVASWYGDAFAGRRTASGERFDPDGLTAAHRSLPFGSMVRVTHTGSGRSVVVRINDRGPFTRGRVIDVSEEAARHLGLIGHGHGEVSLALLTP